MSDSPPPIPQDLKARGRGRKLWRAVLADHNLRPDQLELLAESCRLADLLDRLREVVETEGFVLDGRAHPCLVELRNARLEYRRHLGQLGLEDPVPEPEDKRPGDGIIWIDQSRAPGPLAELKAHRHDPRHGRRSRRKAARGELP